MIRLSDLSYLDDTYVTVIIFMSADFVEDLVKCRFPFFNLNTSFTKTTSNC